jgi:hypothetical protein
MAPGALCVCGWPDGASGGDIQIFFIYCSLYWTHGGIHDDRIQAMTRPAERNDEDGPELVESPLDDKTHAEMLALYRESVTTILFAKTRQWRTVAAVCAAHVVIVAVGHVFPIEPQFDRALIIIGFLISSMAVCILVIFQFWQHTEMLKLRAISGFLSSYFLLVRSIKSRSEANLHRYILLFVMIVSIILTNIIAYMAYHPLLQA